MDKAMTRYSIVLWGYPPHKAETILPEVVRLLDHSIGQSLVWHLESQPEISVTAAPGQWSDVAREQRNEEDGSLSVFCGSPSGLSIGLTLDYPSYVRDFDVLSIGLNTEHLTGLQPMLGFDRLSALFKEGIRLFQPFWGEVCDHELTRTDQVNALRFSIDRTQIPDTIHWFNYFGEGMVDRLGGRDRLLSAPAYEVSVWEDPSGILLILQRDPFDFHNLEHCTKHEEVVRYLQLKRLHALYPRKREVHLAERS
jgi:hypothetical protein